MASWSGWRVLGVWAAWVLAVGFAFTAIVALVLWRARPSGAEFLRSDFAIAFTRTQILASVLLLILPPILFTIVWAWQRHGTR